MINFLKQIFGDNTPDFKKLVKDGAQIIDVRTAAEYQVGSVRNSLNIPLQNLRENLSKIDSSRPVITVCASGMRSSSAKFILQQNGYKEVYNGGGWKNFEEKIK